MVLGKTKRLQVCCALVADQNAIAILLHFIRTCNRSQPHMMLVRRALNILHHVSAHPALVHAVATAPDAVEIMSEQMQVIKLDIHPTFTPGTFL